MLENIWSKLIKWITQTKIYPIYNKFIWKPEKNSLEEFIYNYAKNTPEFTVVQIGANDGYHNDPLYRIIRTFKWKGILVEPQAVVFERLKKTYRKLNGLKFENAAISNIKTKIPFYKISFSDARWATGLASFDKNHLLDHIKKGYVKKWGTREGVIFPEKEEDYITQVYVDTISFDELITKHNVEQVDGIFMDCEGFDEEVLRSIDIEKYNPKLIFFEYFHFEEQNYLTLVSELKELGYTVIKDDMDTLAYKA